MEFGFKQGRGDALATIVLVEFQGSIHIAKSFASLTRLTCGPASCDILYSVTRMCVNAQRDGALPNVGGALCSTPQSLAAAHYQSDMQ